MLSLDYTVEKFESQGQSLATTMNQISDTHIGIWSLASTDSDIPVDVEFLAGRNVGDTSSINGTLRPLLVDEADIAPGGKYRCK